MRIPYFGLIMIFVIWLTYELKKHTRLEKKSDAEFWERERKSGFVPRQSTADISYITIDESFLPVNRDGADSELNALCNRILKYSDKKIADLSDFSNTELKEKYGTGNFTSLSEADTNFTAVVPLLGQLCELLYNEGRLAEAETAADFCLNNGIMTYPVLYTLGQIYDTICAKDKLSELIKKAEASAKCQERTVNALKSLDRTL